MIFIFVGFSSFGYGFHLKVRKPGQIGTYLLCLQERGSGLSAASSIPDTRRLFA